jgi:hypothetical protein
VETAKNLADRNQHRSGSRASGRTALGPTLAVAALGCLAACKPAMVVGEIECPADRAEAGTLPSDTDPITIPWETGFENGPCDYKQVTGFCYGYPPVAFHLVDSPVHTGKYAAAITVVTSTDGGKQPQGRCVRQGGLPVEAYYGAWFLLPRMATNSGLWNLFHFQSKASEPSRTLLYDVSLTTNLATGELNLQLVNRFVGNNPVGGTVPIGQWFHIVLYLKRAKDTSGAVALYLDSQKVFEFTNSITDDTDWAQWYVGNLASDLQPPESTVYLDDVTIRSTL